MILTEKEAGKKWCPQLVHNIGLDNGFPVCCEASKCMAWRWAVDPRGEPAMKKEGDEYRETGYCGLAGEPEATF